MVSAGQRPAAKRLHHNGLDPALVKFPVEILGVDIVPRGVLPIDVVELDLREVPMGPAIEHPVKELFLAVERPAEMADAPGLALGDQKIEDTVVEEPLFKIFVTADVVNQVIVEVIGLKIFHRPMIHRQ